MADNATADTGLLPRTYFKAPRVPLDLRALFLALVGYGVFRLGAYLLEQIFNRDVVSAFFQEVLGRLSQIPYVGAELEKFVWGVVLGVNPETAQAAAAASHRTEIGTFWHDLVGGVWVFAVWAFFGQAVHRITSLRIARDEGLSLKDAIGFSTRNFLTIVYCPIIVAVAIGIFYGCNALAGLVLNVPFVGGILGIVLVPLAALSTLLILLIAIGGAVGLPLVGAAAAWERNGSLDAISRAFSYIFARPLQFFWNYLLVLLLTTVILVAGQHFTKILTGSIDAGLLRDAPSMLVDTPDVVANGNPTYEGWNNDTKDIADNLRGETPRRPFALSFKAVLKAPWGDKITVLVFWAVLNVIQFLVFAAALWWFFGATTSTYADLRADVDGTEEDEIYLEEEEEDFEALAKPDAAAPAAPAPAAPATPPAEPPAPPAPPPAPPPAS